uniref:Nuclear transcription factor Y subunit gamma n=1 Tax=Phallusia mammillata TaxID=59560 RepID=A0A6F9DLJ8_9ASCI|nr:nuclear transcription factor Y subunit gamma [Phallusia mammillata]
MATIISGSSPSLVVSSNMLSSSGASNTSNGATIAVPTSNATDQIVQAQPSEAQHSLQTFWQDQLEEIQLTTSNHFKVQDLPLARVKKIMKMDDDVKMISAEAPLLFAKAAQMFITELSLRAWIHTEENKRRTLQRNDIATAITKFDQFDFLIDIVPREELKPPRRPDEARTGNDGVQYFYTLPQQSQSTQGAPVVGQNQNVPTSNALQAGQQIVLTQPGSQVLQLSQNGQLLSTEDLQNQQIIQIPQQGQQTGGTILIGGNNQTGGIVLNNNQESHQTQNILQQIVGNSSTPSGEVHSIQISPDGQLQLVKMASNSETNQEQS